MKVIQASIRTAIDPTLWRETNCFQERKKKNTTSNEPNRQNRCKINLFVKNSLVFRFVVLQRKDQNIVDESIIKGVKMRRVFNDKSNKVFILLNMILQILILCLFHLSCILARKKLLEIYAQFISYHVFFICVLTIHFKTTSTYFDFFVIILSILT